MSDIARLNTYADRLHALEVSHIEISTKVKYLEQSIVDTKTAMDNLATTVKGMDGKLDKILLNEAGKKGEIRAFKKIAVLISTGITGAAGLIAWLWDKFGN